MDHMGINHRINSHPFHSFLGPLKGKTVTIYRGGPESKTGILLDVKADHVTLYVQNNNNNNNNKNNNQNMDNQQNDNQQNDNQNTVVYYRTEHVKSISEDPKTNSMQSFQDEDEEEIEYLQADDFSGLLNQLINETIQINQGGPEYKHGVLMGVTEDYLILYTEDDGIVYFNHHHVKSISQYQDNYQSDNEQGNDDKNNNLETIERAYQEIIDASSFHDVFNHLSYKWVSINRGGPEAMEGVLVASSDGYYTIVSNQEVLRIHPYHIRSISVGAKGSLKQNNQDNNEEDQNNQEDRNYFSTEEFDESSNLKSSNRRTSRHSRRTSRDSRRTSRDSRRTSKRNDERNVVVKTIDYIWNPKH